MINHVPALLQVSTRDQAFLFDLLHLDPSGHDANGMIAALANLFADPAVLKLGFAWRGDLRVLRKAYRLGDPRRLAFQKTCSFLDLEVWRQTSARTLHKNPALFSLVQVLHTAIAHAEDAQTRSKKPHPNSAGSFSLLKDALQHQLPPDPDPSTDPSTDSSTSSSSTSKELALICKQVEFYFSDANLRVDAFMQVLSIFSHPGVISYTPSRARVRMCSAR
jgi:hypothetical protein